jgi:polyisoprenoid-binding protein YceI
VPGEVLTVTDVSGRQLARAVADDTGAVATAPLPPGRHTAVVAAPGYRPAAQLARVGVDGSARLGEIVLMLQEQSIMTPPPGPWVIDPIHSVALITARHLGIASIKARFAQVGGRLDIAGVFEQSTGYAEIDASSIDTGIGMRDDHLRSADFLEVENYPVIRFTGTGLRRTGSDSWVMPGELELHGQQRPVDLTVVYGGSGPDPWGGVRAAFHAETLLRRDDFDISYNTMLRAGIAAIGTTVQVELDIQLVQGDPPPPL